MSINHNLENVELLLDELDVIGISETKITNADEGNAHPSIPGYVFEHMPTPLASGGTGLFVDQSVKYNVLEKTSNEAFQALWVEIFFVYLRKHRLWNNLSSAQFARLFPNVSR